MLAAINRSSALWQQFGFLGDVIHAPKTGSFAYYEALPVAHVHDTLMTNAQDYFVITLEYGTGSKGDLFAAHRIPRDAAERAGESQFLHPVVRRCSRGRVVAEHHVIEDLEAAWIEDVHISPLVRFFQQQLTDFAADALNPTQIAATADAL